MTTFRDYSTSYSGFLSLPTELRCHIYDYLLADSHSITVSAAYITIFGHRIQDRARKTVIPGLPLDLAPLVRTHHDASLLSVSKPPEIAIDDGWMGDVGKEAGTLGLSAPVSLLLSCRLVHDELNDYMKGRREIRTVRARSEDWRPEDKDSEKGDKEGLSLYVTYPYGVLVLKSLYPYLLKQARRVYISGYYTSPAEAEPGSPSSSDGGSDDERLTPTNSFVQQSFSSTQAHSFRRRSVNSLWSRTNKTTPSTTITNPTRPRLRLDTPLPQHHSQTSTIQETFPQFPPTTATHASAALSHLIRTLLPSNPTHLINFSARILYPGENSYGTIWSDEQSPISHILRNVCGGTIEMKVKRGSLATGLTLTASHKPEARVVSTSWENWRARFSAGPGGMRRRARMDCKDLDMFLMGEE